MPDPLRADGTHEYAHYLAENGAGDEFRANRDIVDAFFDGDGKLDAEALARLKDDVAALLYPTRQRALELDKAYRTIVLDQDFIHGRDAQPTPVETVERVVEQDRPTGIETPAAPRWR